MQGDAPSIASSVKSSVASSSTSTATSNHKGHDVIMPSGDGLGTAYLLRHRYGVFVSFMALQLMLRAGYGTAQVVRAYALGWYDPGPLQPSTNLTCYLTNAKGDPCQFFDFVSKGWQKKPGVANYSKALQQRLACAAGVSLVLEAGSAAGSSHQVFQKCAHLTFNQQDRLAEVHCFLGRFNLSWPASHPRRSKLETLDVLVTLDWGVPVLSQLTVDTHFKRPGFRTLHFTCNPYTFQCFLTRNVLPEKGPVLAYVERASAILNGSAAPKRTVEEVLKMPVRVLVLKTAAVSLLMNPRPDYELLHVVIKQTDITAPCLSAAECLMVVNRHLPMAFGRDDEMFVLNKRLLRLVTILAGNIEGTTGLLVYVNWHVVRHLAPMTSRPLPREQFIDGRGADKSSLGYMTGRCYTDVDAALPLAFAHVFNRRWLAASSVRNATASLCRFRSVARATIAPLPWIDGEMRRGALEKLAILHAVVGFLEQGSENEGALRWLFPHVPELSGSYLNMSLALHETELNVSMGFFCVHGTTSQEVGFPLTVVNASYVLAYQVIVIPAAILYPRCYVACYPSSYNFASLGHVMGPENTHVFHPDQALFIRDGLCSDWWTPASSKKFSRQLACLRRLHNETPWTGAVRYGAQALCKNLAVGGGLLKAYREYRLSVALQHSDAAQQETTFTGEQFFAISCFKWCSEDDQGPVCYSLPGGRCNGPLMNLSEFAQVFHCAPGSAMNHTNTVWYSLLGARCNGPLMNMPEFAQAFDCALGSAMNQTSRCDAM